MWDRSPVPSDFAPSSTGPARERPGQPVWTPNHVTKGPHLTYLFLLLFYLPSNVVEVAIFGGLWPDLGLLRAKDRLPMGSGTQARVPSSSPFADEEMEPK